MSHVDCEPEWFQLHASQLKLLHNPLVSLVTALPEQRVWCSTNNTQINSKRKLNEKENKNGKKKKTRISFFHKRKGQEVNVTDKECPYLHRLHSTKRYKIMLQEVCVFM